MAKKQDGISILLVEDEVMLSHLLVPRLEREGYKVTLAQDGEEAFSQVKEKVFDLIIFDLCLPKQSGFEAMERIVKDKTLRHGPIIVFSNLSSAEDVERAKKLEVAMYLVKTNTTHEELLFHIKSLIQPKGGKEVLDGEL